MNCPEHHTPMADAEVVVKMDGVLVNKFDGWLCARCRKIWASTEVSGAIDMRLLS